MLVYTSRQFDALSGVTMAYSANSLAIADDVSSLQEITIAMERGARQYYILADPRLLRDFDEAFEDGKQIANRLVRSLRPQGQSLASRWVALGESVGRLVRQSRVSDTRLQQDVYDKFRELALTTRQIEKESRLTIQQGAQVVERDGVRYRHTLISIGVCVTLISILIAMMLGLWLSWLFDELALAIAELGNHKRREFPQIGGPSDVFELAERIRSVGQTLEALERDKEAFVRHVSHELKTPLANLREGIALLDDEAAGNLTEGQKHIVGILSNNAGSLQAQIEELLQYNAAVFESARLKIVKFDVQALIKDIIAEQRMRCDARGIHAEVTGNATQAWLDREKVRIIVSNLLSNAIDFSPQGGRISFDVTLINGQLVLDCVDEGCGVAPEEFEKIFDPFYQGSRQTPGLKRGTGIGLSIVQTLAGVHGGHARILPSEIGAHFRITLPHALP